jgi:hypothetical protein
VLVDTQLGKNSTSLAVGGAAPDVVDFSLTQSAAESAQNIEVFGKGDFTETYEILEPDWDLDHEFVAFGPTAFAFPNSAEGVSAVYLGHDWVQDLDINILTHPDPYGIGLPMQAWGNGSDYAVHQQEGKIYWNKASIWVHEPTGAISYAVLQPGAEWRRPIGYGIDDMSAVITGTISYSYLHEDAFRKYHCQYPIANIRLREKVVPDPLNPGSSITVVIEQDETIQAYKPIFNPVSPIADDPPAHGPWGLVEDGGNSIAQYVTHTIFDQSDYAFFNDFVLNPTTQEGTLCVTFDERQLIRNIVMWNIPGIPTPKPISWDIVLHYTKWSNLRIARTSSDGSTGYYVRAVHESVFKYTDIDGVTLIDQTAALEEAADALEDYAGSPNWQGSIVVHVDLDTRWECPFNPGMKVALSGIAGDLSDFEGIVNSVDYAQIDAGQVTLSIGRTPPKRNPYASPAPRAVDVEGYRAGDYIEVTGLRRI